MAAGAHASRASAPVTISRHFFFSFSLDRNWPFFFSTSLCGLVDRDLMGLDSIDGAQDFLGTILEGGSCRGSLEFGGSGIRTQLRTWSWHFQ